MLSFNDLAESANGLCKGNVGSGDTREFLGNVKGLRKKALNFSCSSDQNFIFVGKTGAACKACGVNKISSPAQCVEKQRKYFARYAVSV